MGRKDLNILPDLSRSEWEYLIDEWIFSERDRYIIKRKLLDNIHYETLSEEVGLSVTQTKYIVSKSKKILFKHSTKTVQKSNQNSP